MVANVALDVCSKVKSEVVPTLPHRECMQQLLKFCLLEIIAEHLGLGIIGECMRYGPIYLLYTLAFAQDTRMSSILPVFDCLLKNFANYSFFCCQVVQVIYDSNWVEYTYETQQVYLQHYTCSS